ncbi:MAG: YlxM family DNA-binding protein [Lachnospiraceae bacterium]|nr:YlxM family DNA-binding protein [Lachnospiraceae bacterium]
MEEFVKHTMLYDLYGELLTERQRAVYESIVFEDLSLAEAAEQYGISRQAVHDMVRRTSAALEEYEAKLHLMERLLAARERVGEISRLCAQGAAAPAAAYTGRGAAPAEANTEQAAGPSSGAKSGRTSRESGQTDAPREAALERIAALAKELENLI